jgi:hypothetical protein
VRTLVWCALAAASLVFAQQATEKKPQSSSTETTPKPLFGGKLNLKSSKTTKESAPMAFNGIDPNGKVDAAMMATTPSDEDKKKVDGLDKARPKGEQVAKFVADGGLEKQ